MPTRNPVTAEMVLKWKEKFKIVAKDLGERACIGTLISFIILLYEVVITCMTYKFSPGKLATYKEVSRHLPCRNNERMLVMVRDGLTHELYSITNIVEYVLIGCNKFGKENFDYLSQECFDNEIDLYDTIMSACNKIRADSDSAAFPNKMNF